MNADAEFAELLWRAADLLGNAVSATEDRARDPDWCRNHGDIADDLVLGYDQVRVALRSLATRHDRAIVGRMP